MIDHISVGVRSLDASRVFYEAALGILGYSTLVERPRTLGFGKRYPEFWINLRPNRSAADAEDGAHICLRARSPDQVDEFHRVALANGGITDGAPGPRDYDVLGHIYYAAFVRRRRNIT